MAGDPRNLPARRRFSRPRRGQARAYHQLAQQRLRRFRQGSALAVALTAFLLLLWGGPLELHGQPQLDPPPAAAEPADLVPRTEIVATFRDLGVNFLAFVPRLLIVLAMFTAAAGITRLVNALVHRLLGEWERVAAAKALVRLVVFVVAAVAALSVLTGDIRAVVGSVGLLGLAASWALQTPIESFTGWLLNSFRSYYRVGDRIAVGDVFGDVYKIDVLTTTVWEAGGPGKPVAAAQPTGALITFPNWEVLRSNVVNYSRDFPYVWDEVTVSVANESDLAYTARVLRQTAMRTLGGSMAEAAREYERLLVREHLQFEVEELPQVYLSSGDSWTDCTVRYLVPVRSRRSWASKLVLEFASAVANPEHRGRILAVYPRTEVKLTERWPLPEPTPPPGPPE